MFPFSFCLFVTLWLQKIENTTAIPGEKAAIAYSEAPSFEVQPPGLMPASELELDECFYGLYKFFTKWFSRKSSSIFRRPEDQEIEETESVSGSEDIDQRILREFEQALIYQDLENRISSIIEAYSGTSSVSLLHLDSILVALRGRVPDILEMEKNIYIHMEWMHDYLLSQRTVWDKVRSNSQAYTNVKRILRAIIRFFRFFNQMTVQDMKENFVDIMIEKDGLLSKKQDEVRELVANVKKQMIPIHNEKTFDEFKIATELFDLVLHQFSSSERLTLPIPEIVPIAEDLLKILIRKGIPSSNRLQRILKLIIEFSYPAWPLSASESDESE